ncbi:MAG TPA: hypothetical protein VGV67_05380 [Solirubrobacteraceae bacterium]|nr:hypothetical protein [Solirubrobacteraceae bacterium]
MGAAVVAFALAASAPAAVANVPPPVTKTNTVRVPALGNAANGTLTTRVTYTDAAATAAASTGNTIGLGRGFYFRLRTCVSYHLSSTPPRASCAERDVDTRANSATVYTYAPPVTLAGMPRPTTQPWGHFTSYTEVTYQSGTAWPLSAHSWPADGLQGAGVPVAAQGQSTAVLPPNGSVTLDGAFSGAVNSGQPDSICFPRPAPANGSALPAGVTTYTTAFQGAPAYYEVGSPTGAYAGQAARGVMLVIHGGAFVKTGVGAVQEMRPDADRWRARGWLTANISYRGCGQSPADVLWFYDRTRAAVGAGMKVCALGTSAGANLALLIGAYRPDLHCAVNQAGPTDLRVIRSEVAFNSATGAHDQTAGPRWVHNMAAAAFGEESLATYSPAALAAGSLRSTRVLQAVSFDDPLVPYRQTADLADAMRAANAAAYVDSVQLAPGAVQFGHGLVSQAALNDFYSREAQLAGG